MYPGSLPSLNLSSAESEPFSRKPTLNSFFNTIPPERIGLNGEYDHSGLAKRVSLVFGQEFHASDVATLKVRQRGGVIVLIGRVSTPRLLARMIQTALRVDGAIDVETCGVIVESNRESSNTLDYLKSRLHAC